MMSASLSSLAWSGMMKTVFGFCNSVLTCLFIYFFSISLFDPWFFWCNRERSHFWFPLFSTKFHCTCNFYLVTSYVFDHLTG